MLFRPAHWAACGMDVVMGRSAAAARSVRGVGQSWRSVRSVEAAAQSATTAGPTPRRPHCEPAEVRVERARLFIEAHATQRVSLETLAELAGVSTYHCIRLFNRVLGESPHVYQLRRRIELARALLAKGLPGSRVAVETGFSDQSHFIRMFRRFTGGTPTEIMSGSCPTLLVSRSVGDGDGDRSWDAGSGAAASRAEA
jgi:AraC-like DNA-binding protein